MKEDDESFLSGHVSQDLAHQSSMPVTTISMTTLVTVYVFAHIYMLFLLFVAVLQLARSL